MFFPAKTQKNDHRPDIAYYAVKQLIYFRYNIFINVLPAFLEMVCNKFCIFFQSDRLLIQNHSTLIKSRKTYKNFSRFPFIERDIALVVDEEIAVGNIINLAKNIKNSQLIC